MASQQTGGIAWSNGILWHRQRKSSAWGHRFSGTGRKNWNWGSAETSRDIANIKELKKRGLALRAIKELVPRISRTAPGSTDSKVKLLEDEQPEREKLLEFQKILERLITQELHMKKEGEDQCRDLDEAIRNRQLARKEAAVTLEKKNRGNKKKGKRHL